MYLVCPILSSLWKPSVIIPIIVDVCSSFSFVAIKDKRNNIKKVKILEKEEDEKNALFFFSSPLTIVECVVEFVRRCNRQEKKNKNQKGKKLDEKKKRRTYLFLILPPLHLIVVFLLKSVSVSSKVKP